MKGYLEFTTNEEKTGIDQYEELDNLIRDSINLPPRESSPTNEKQTINYNLPIYHLTDPNKLCAYYDDDDCPEGLKPNNLDTNPNYLIENGYKTEE